MKKLNYLLVLVALMFTTNAFSQGMEPPKPVQSELINSMEGTWISEPYEMMGMKMTDEVTQSWILNGQFFEVRIKSKGENGFDYEGLVILAPSDDGTMTGTGYDIFGKNGITTYTSTSEGNTVYMTGKSIWGSETRNITMDGNIMTHSVIYNMMGQDGKEMPPMSMSISYNKK
ncbi:MAG TPA: hypothetical protein PKA90_13550 [Ignavibacteria bacterium]|nr:hypothetical protein [Ignavibacteria bacterium]HMR41444.1 hypothetical protein [Ignavibacteria bacterium]